MEKKNHEMENRIHSGNYFTVEKRNNFDNVKTCKMRLLEPIFQHCEEDNSRAENENAQEKIAREIEIHKGGHKL